MLNLLENKQGLLYVQNRIRRRGEKSMYAQLIEPANIFHENLEEKPSACWFYGRSPEQGGICVIGLGPVSPYMM
jgi:hypothetical protein